MVYSPYSVVLQLLNPVTLLYAQKVKDKPTETSSEGTNTTSDPLL